MRIAITREVSPSIGRCELTHLARQPIDVDLARAQHRAYEVALAALGCEVHSLPAAPDLPDSVFVEDTAVVVDEVAIITRPGATSRRPEVPAVADALAHVELRTGDFELAIDGIAAGDFVYFDPPYYKQGGYSDFNRYTPEQFRDCDHVRLAALCHELDSRGVRWAVSNSDTSFVQALFADFRIRKIRSRREINLRSGRRSIQELFISNY